MKNILRILVLCLLLLNGLGAIYGGWNLIHDPTGQSIQLPFSYIEHTFFKNYLIPGIVLVVCNGFVSFLTFTYLWQYHRYAGYMVVIQGFLLIVWLIVQIVVIQVTFFLQGVFAILGLIFIFSGLYFARRNSRGVSV